MKSNSGNDCTQTKLALYVEKFNFSFSDCFEKLLREFEEEKPSILI